MKCLNCGFNVISCFNCCRLFKRHQTVRCYLTASGLREHKHENKDDCDNAESIFTFKE